MTPIQFQAFIADLNLKTDTLTSASINLQRLIQRVKVVIDRNDSLSSPLSQADVDHILAVQTPIYNSAKAAISTAFQALP